MTMEGDQNAVETHQNSVRDSLKMITLTITDLYSMAYFFVFKIQIKISNGIQLKMGVTHTITTYTNSMHALQWSSASQP